MFKWLLKKLLPKPETMAKMAADAIKRCVNESGKADVIAKYATLSSKATEIANFATTTLSDGYVDDNERDDITKMLTPLFKAVQETL